MGNQSIFYGYFQSWEWTPLWKDNDLQRVAGEHRSIIKSSIIHCILVIPMVIGILYALYHYKLLRFYEFEQIVWFDALWLEEYISNAWVLPVYWYILLGFTALFFGFLVYFNIYKYYPSYSENYNALNSRLTLAYRKIFIQVAINHFKSKYNTTIVDYIQHPNNKNGAHKVLGILFSGECGSLYGPSPHLIGSGFDIAKTKESRHMLTLHGGSYSDKYETNHIHFTFYHIYNCPK